MVNKLPPDLPKIIRYDSFNCVNYHLVKKISIHLTFKILIFYFIFLSRILLLRRSIQSKNYHNHRTLLTTILLHVITNGKNSMKNNIMGVSCEFHFLNFMYC